MMTVESSFLAQRGLVFKCTTNNPPKLQNLEIVRFRNTQDRKGPKFLLEKCKDLT